MKKTIINYSKIIALCVSIISMTSCEEALIGPAVLNTPQTNFEEMWKSYDQYYGLFTVKEVDWQATYDVYAPLINDQTTDEELKDIFH